MPDPSTKARATFLSPPDFRRLDWACRPIVDAYGEPVYLVGSVLERADYRDIDLRLILADDVMERMLGADETYGLHNRPTPFGVRQLLNVALSDFIARAANLPAPVDFQIQSMSEANVPEHGSRNPIGMTFTRSEEA